MSERWIRSQRAAVVDVGERCLLVVRDGTLRALEGDSAELARAVIGYLEQPRTQDEVTAHVEALAGPLGERAGVVDQLLELLRSTGVIQPAADPPSRLAGLNVVVGISGAIAATHAPAFVRALQQRGHTVEIALTPTAQRFVSVDALSAIVQRRVHASIWPAAPHEPVPHIALGAWAELVVIYPASATTISRIAHGDYSELVAAVASCTRAPVIVVPSMNASMFESPAVVRNLETLRGDGKIIVGGVPSAEAADAPSVRGLGSVAAPAPGEVAVTIEALRAADELRARPSDWDAVYRAARPPWASDACDADIAEALARHAPAKARVLDLGSGLGQVARHAASLGHAVVATDVSEVALALANRSTPDGNIVWLRDDICATRLATTFDVVIDRATLHALGPAREAAWFASVRRLVRPGGVVIVKAHTTGWSGAALVERFAGDFELVSESAAELPGPQGAAPVPSVLVVLRARRGRR